MISYIMYRVVQWIAMTFPKRFTYRLAVFIADIFYIFRWRLRKAVLENLRYAFPEKGKREINSYARLTFRNFGKYLVDFFRFDKFDRKTMDREVTILGLENIERCLKEGKGLITVTAHLGNWELGGVIMALLGYKFNVVALSHGSDKVDELFVRQRENKGVRVIPLGRAASHCIRALKRNELVALLGDRDIDGSGVRVEFFDRHVSVPRGPAVLAIHNHTPIIPGFLIRRDDNRFSLILNEPIPEAETENREDRIKKLTREFVKVIENYIRRFPGQWFMFYPVGR